VGRLAELGDLEAPQIEAERLRDGTAVGDLGAVTALAARPTVAAKSAAWAEMTEDLTSPSAASGHWPPGCGRCRNGNSSRRTPWAVT
jgi:aminopeptidase N